MEEDAMGVLEIVPWWLWWAIAAYAAIGAAVGIVFALRLYPLMDAELPRWLNWVSAVFGGVLCIGMWPFVVKDLFGGMLAGIRT